MVRAAALALGLWAGAAAADEPARHVVVETVAEHAEVFRGEPVRVTVRILLDRDWAAAHLVQPFHRELDVPLQVELPWVRDGGGPRLRPRAGPGRPATLAMHDEVVAWHRADPVRRDGRAWTVLAYERVLLPEETGTLELPAPTVRALVATEFREDFLAGRVGVDPRPVAVRGEPLRLAVRPWPAEGRPDVFTGAVGRFTVSADARPRDPREGEAFRLVLRVEGEGNWELLGAPRLDDLPGLHRYGMLEARAPGRCVFTYDLVPLSADVARVPPIAFAWLVPRPAPRYETARTDPVPLAVRPDPARDAAEPRAPAAPPERLPVLPLAAAGVAAVVAAVLFTRRARARGAVDPAVARRRAARTAVERAARDGGAELPDRFGEYLAAALGCDTAAVISPDLPARLRATGVPEALAERTARRVEALVAGRYGAADAAAPAATADLVRELDAVFEAAPESRTPG